MDKLIVENIEYSGPVGGRHTSETLQRFSYEFEFGYSYGIQAPYGFGSWALCWLLAGAIVPEHGRIFLNSKQLDAKQLRQLSWLVYYDEIKRFGFLRQSVQAQLHAHRSNINETSIIEKFYLVPERIDRSIWHIGSEIWRASCAIGYAQGRRIFCFPHIGFFRADLINEYRFLWLERVINVLKATNALILLPSVFQGDDASLMNKVIKLY
jgi:energy-coupling factor transporter ATP-binding protein EcfA2